MIILNGLKYFFKNKASNEKLWISPSKENLGFRFLKNLFFFKVE